MHCLPYLAPPKQFESYSLLHSTTSYICHSWSSIYTLQTICKTWLVNFLSSPVSHPWNSLPMVVVSAGSVSAIKARLKQISFWFICIFFSFFFSMNFSFILSLRPTGPLVLTFKSILYLNSILVFNINFLIHARLYSTFRFRYILFYLFQLFIITLFRHISQPERNKNKNITYKICALDCNGAATNEINAK